MKKQILSEEVNRMQKLAGLLTEEEKEVEKLQIVDTKSEENNAQKLIRENTNVFIIKTNNI
jgi:hypothetical protein